MKSLNESIAEIKNARTSTAAKKAALIVLGLRPQDLWLVLPSDADAGTAAPRKSFTFGVEIECGVPRNAIASAAEQTGLYYRYEGYNHDDGKAYFKFVRDGSLTCADSIECVSPVLKGTNGKKALKTVCETLNRAGATVNRSCGLHVHIGAATLTGAQYANVFANYAMLERVIDTFMAPSRRNNVYARSLAGYDFTHAAAFSDIRRILGRNRYHKVNAESYHAHKTIEFRQHGGTTDYEKISRWVQFCGKLVEWSKTHCLMAPVQSIDDIEFLNAAEKRFFKARAAKFANA